jgi:hypothetical protein
MVYFFKTPSPKAGRSVRFASSPVKSDRRLLVPTNLKLTVGQYSRTDHTNTVTWYMDTLQLFLLNDTDYERTQSTQR